LRVTYKRYRNFCSDILKKQKRDYERQQIQITKNNNKLLWKTIKEITYTKKPKEDSSMLLLKNDPIKSINDVNSFFVNVGKKLAENIIRVPGVNKSSSLNHCLNSFVLLPTDCNEVKSLINNLKTDCSVGLDLISADILKTFVDILVLPITHICNLALSTGIFPSAFKKSRITPIYKSGSKDCINNYRPISILSTLSKILERIMNNRLIKYLEDQKLLAQAQFGFRVGKSTADAVHKVTDFLVNNLDNKKKTAAVFLDIAKAFDTVSVEIMINKLENLGVRDLQLKLFRDYLSNRTQCVQIDNFISEELPIYCGVPQGSILGPTLFLVYINDLCQQTIPNAKIVTFADDTALLFSGDTWDEVFSCAQKGYNQVTQWLKANILSLNVEKTFFMTFSLRDQCPNNPNFNIISHSCNNDNDISCMCPRLQKSRCVRYLGVMIDDRLTFQSHIDTVTSRVRKLIVIFKNLRHIADMNLIRSVYFALCQSILSYCVIAWGGAIKSTLLKLERAQRAVLKVSLSLPYRHPTVDLYDRCNVLTVRQLFILEVLLKQHSTIKYEPHVVNKKRRKDIVCINKRFNSSFSHRFFCYQGANLYNRANRILSMYSSPKGKCKTSIRNWLQKLCYISTEDLL
jgi:hypothetical protein